MPNKTLKIFLVISGSASSVTGSEVMFYNILNSLEKMGHEVTLFDFKKEWANLSSNTDRQKKTELTELILKKFNKQPIGFYNLFLSFLSDQYVTPELYKEFKGKCLTVNWSCNSHQFNDLHRDISPVADLNTYITLDHKDLYDSVNAESYWMPMAANPNYYKNDPIKDIDISFIGTAYYKRPYYIWRLLQSGHDIDVSGVAWNFDKNFLNFIRIYIYPTVIAFSKDSNKMHLIENNTRVNIIRLINKNWSVGGPLSDNDYTNKLSRSYMTLNFPEARNNHNFMDPNMIWGVNFRDFEAPMSGALLITQFSKELEHFYEDGKEVISFNNEHELLDKVNFYSRNKKSGEIIAQAGYERAIKDHTWESRFRDLFIYLEKDFNL
tara:strand:+ start:1548 stop:2687 length:1140 start_codon:yes stop_codon:yes gene_type:complete